MYIIHTEYSLDKMSVQNIQEINLSPDRFQDLLEKNNGVLIFKFGATWCNPCKQIEPYLDRFANECPKNIKCYDVDVDESFETFAHLKRYRVLKNIPTILCYYKGNKHYMPNDSCIGSNIPQLQDFFMRVAEKANTI